MSFSLYKELQSPTGAEHAVWARLLPAAPPLLVVARGTVLDAFSVQAVDDAEGRAAPAAQLHLLESFQLAGDVRGLCVLPLSGRGAASVAGLKSIDILVVSFAHAKVSYVGLDPFMHKLCTLGMLNFEEHGVGPGCSVQGRQQARQQTGMAQTGEARADPAGRAVALFPYGDQLAVIPVRRTVEGLDDAEDKDLEEDAAAAAAEADEAAAAAVRQDRATQSLLHKPYVLNLREVGQGLSGTGLGGTVRDAAFLHGYSVAPTLAVLVTTAITNASRLASLAHTASLAALSLDTAGTATVLWQRDGLPADSYALVALPEPVGGALVLSPNAILHANHFATAGLALNGHAAYTVDVRGKYRLDTNISHDGSAPAVCLALNAARAVVIAPDRVLLTEASGAMHMLHIATVGRGEVHHLTLHPALVRGPPAAALAWLPASAQAAARVSQGLSAPAGLYAAGLLFTASRISDSVLSVVAARLRDAGAARAPPALAGGAGVDDDDMLYSGAGGGSAGGVAAGIVGRKRPREEEEEAAPGVDGEEEEAPPGLDAAPVAPARAAAAAAAAADEDDDELLYGTRSETGGAGSSSAAGGAAAGSGGSSAALPLLVVQPVDSLPSLGAIADCVTARCARVPSEDDEEPPLAPPPTELILASSRYETGGITVLHRALRPVLASQLRLVGCRGLFSLPMGSEGEGLVLMSSESATRMLAVGEGLAELESDATELVTGARTLAAAALLRPSTPLEDGSTADGSRAVLLQVHDAGVRVVRAVPGSPVVQELSLSLPTDVGGLGGAAGATITAASDVDPYVLLRWSDGSLRLLTASQEDGEVVAEVVTVAGDARDGVTAASLYREGEGGVLSAALGAAPAVRVFALIARRSGALEVYAVPSFTRLFVAPAVHLGPQVVVNTLTAPAVPAGAHGGAGSATAALVSEAGEPCEDGGAAGGEGHPPPRPRTFIRDLTALRLSHSSLALVAVTARDDVYAYTLVRGSAPPQAEEQQPAMGSGRGPAPVAPPVSIPKRGAATAEPESDEALARFLDVGHPLQVHRAAAPRFIRMACAPGSITRFAAEGAPEFDPAVADAALKTAVRPALRPFRDVSGWAGVAVLTPSPLLLLSLRGTLVSLPLGFPDTVGAAGPTALPGEHLPFGSGGGGGAFVTAFAPFSAPFCPSGFVYAHAGHVQISTLPRPQWSATPGGAAAGLPRPVPAWLLTGADGGAPALARGATALALYGGGEEGGAQTALPLTPAAGGEAEDWPAVPATELFTPPAAPAALVCPGPAAAPFYRIPTGRSVSRLAYLEFASAALGVAALKEWSRKTKATPTSSQAACCVQPLFAVGMSTRVVRDYDAEVARNAAELERTGEYEQVNVGEHVEFGPVPLPPAHRPHARSRMEEPPPAINPDPVAEAFNAARLNRPPSYDDMEAVVLLWGSGAEPGSGWGVVDSYALQQDEHITSIVELPLPLEGAGSKVEPTLVVGTAFLQTRGEDAQPKGRLLLFKLSSPSTSQPRLKLLFEDDIRVVPSTLAVLKGRTLAGETVRTVLVGAGKRLQVYEWHTKSGTPRLRMCCLADFRTQVTAIEVVRDFVIVTDASAGLFFYRWREEDKQLIPLHQAPGVRRLTAASATVSGDKLGIVTLDAHGNILIHAYTPRESFARLQVVADFRLGATGTAERLVRSRLAFPAGTPATERRKHGVLVPTHAGGVGMLLPLDETVFKRLAMLQRVMTYCVPHAGGLNPKLQRLVESHSTPGLAVRPARNILDGPLLTRFTTLTSASAAALAASVGTTADRVLANLRDLDLATTVV